MKFTMIFSVVALMAVGSLTASAKDDNGGTREQMVAVNDAYIPNGFDSSSDAFVVINGLFPNTCYKIKESKVTHVGAALHEVRTTAMVTEGLCLTVLVPFSKEVQLGKLDAGKPLLRFVNGDGTFWDKSLTIEN